ncbi:sigma-70 family RNA polymerase sigma factor [Streptomyces sp. ISL-86]|nr:sigma-70 family RNA polymerase sigma factor [Streptomyces sp. ISL-86]
MRQISDSGQSGMSAYRWQQIWSHREQLLKVARRRSMSLQDAEDAVHEAMVRAAECPHLDGDRLGAWLTSVTVRLCVDRFRQLSRDAEVHTRSALTAPGQVTVEEAVCDRAEARWLAGRSRDLPARQAEALRLKAEDLDVAQVAGQLGLSYRAVESLLVRARRTLRATLAGTLALAAWAWRARPQAGGGAQTAGLVSAAATLVIVVLTLPTPSEAQGSPPAPPRRSGAASPAAPDPASKSLPASYEPATSPVPAEGSAGSVLPHPAEQDASGPSAGAGAPLPDAPTSAPPSVPDAPLPPLPALPDAALPALPTPPDAPAAVPPVPVDSAPVELPGGLVDGDVPLLRR